MRRRKILVVFLIVFSVLLISFTFYGYQVLNAPNVLVEKQDRDLLIEPGETFKSLQDKLHKGKYVDDLVAFSFLAKLMKYDENIKPGIYRLKKNMSNQQAIRLLRSGQQNEVNVTFNNVRLIEQLPEKIVKNMALAQEDFKSELDLFIEKNAYGFNENTVISMFIPNTYRVYYTTSAEELIKRMYDEYEQFWSEDRKAKANKLGMTQLEVSTLASIVQAESVKEDEKKRIAGLYVNRLKKGIALQADPTLVFAHRDFGLKRVLNKHKEIESPYNTYKYAGLPPGPINMPSISSIDAVLNYEEHDYFYMCAKEDFSGYHNFAKTHREHMVNARKYQRQLTIEQRKARQNSSNR